jgi:DnaJ family protein C protein 28
LKDIEEHIRRAMEEGKFDDLPGKGKPLRLDDNPYEDPEWSTAYRMLRSGGFTLPWIEAKLDIENDQETARQNLKRSWEYRSISLAKGEPSARVEVEWQRALEAFRSQIETLNQRIFSYNLQVPSPSFQLLMMDSEREIQQISGGPV